MIFPFICHVKVLLGPPEVAQANVMLYPWLEIMFSGDTTTLLLGETAVGDSEENLSTMYLHGTELVLTN